MERKGRRAHQVVQLDGGNALVNTRDDLLCDSSRIDMVRIKTIAQSRDTRSDFVELDAFCPAVCMVAHCQYERRGKRRGGGEAIMN